MLAKENNFEYKDFLTISSLNENLNESKYFELMNQIDSDMIYERLLGFGMFSEKIPPFLSSEPFMNYCKNISTNFKQKPMGFIHFDAMRNNGLPRPLGIPTPMAYENLCKVLSDNWKEIKKELNNNTQNDTHKISRIHIRRSKSSNSLFQMNYKNFRIDGNPELDILIGSKYRVDADISSCFPSMYTHSLAWALAGKVDAKKNKNNKNMWYNQLDFNTMNTTNGETHGLLIGPHSSNLLSEIILTKVDFKLSPKYEYIRNIDDYSCYVASHDEASQFLLDLSKELREYGLLLNHKKTKIIKLPLSNESDWVRELSSNLPSTEPIKFNEVRAFIDRAISIMNHNDNNAAILNYAIKVIVKKKITNNARGYLIKSYYHLALIYPYLLFLLEEYLLIPLAITKDELQGFINKLYNQEFSLRNFEAVSYALYFSVKYDFTIKNYSFDDIEDSGNAIVYLLGYLYAQKNNISTTKYEILAKKLIGTEHDFYENWLFVFEVLNYKEFKPSWNKHWNDWINIKKQISFVDI